ncbi:hypothetical protein [Actinomadura harenae]|uniref:hypothetical protein n=1 Tax=Actinomadura harenae TaxID=2483351 RepID=UPI0018F3CF5D|nr:hypothetical protein [Actinomadura harenae]
MPDAALDPCARHGVEPWEFDVLATLLRSGLPYVLCAGDQDRLADLLRVLLVGLGGGASA